MKCVRCGNTKRDELNIEAMVHHAAPVLCYNQKACRRRTRKLKRTA